MYQKVTDAGRVTKSAHPGAALFGFVSALCVVIDSWRISEVLSG